MAKEKICTVCGKPYKYCSTCKKEKSWRSYACSHSCFQVRMIFQDMREGVIDEEQAAEMFTNIGITAKSAKDNYLEAVADEIIRILKKAETTVEADTAKVEKPKKKD